MEVEIFRASYTENVYWSTVSRQLKQQTERKFSLDNPSPRIVQVKLKFKKKNLKVKVGETLLAISARDVRHCHFWRAPRARSTAASMQNSTARRHSTHIRRGSPCDIIYWSRGNYASTRSLFPPIYRPSSTYCAVSRAEPCAKLISHAYWILSDLVANRLRNANNSGIFATYKRHTN